MTDIKVKPWWQSASLWTAVATAVGIVLQQLIVEGHLSDTGIAGVVITAIALITKRGLVEHGAHKANAILAATLASDPTQPSAEG